MIHEPQHPWLAAGDGMLPIDIKLLLITLLIVGCVPRDATQNSRESWGTEDANGSCRFLDHFELPVLDPQFGLGRFDIRMYPEDVPGSFKSQHNFLLLKDKDDPGVRRLVLPGFGYEKFHLSQGGYQQAEFIIRSNDILPLGQELYRFTFKPDDEWVVVDRVTAAFSEQITLTRDCARICTNLTDKCLMNETPHGGNRNLDLVSFDEFLPEESGVVVSLVQHHGKQQQTIHAGDTWKPRWYEYEVISVVAPQDTEHGRLVGWVELSLKEPAPK